MGCKMPNLTLITDDSTREIPFYHGSTVRELLDAAGIRIRSGCRGNGACGLCLVQIVAGSANLPTKNERLILSPEQIERSIRFACQTDSRKRPLHPNYQYGLEIRLVGPKP